MDDDSGLHETCWNLHSLVCFALLRNDFLQIKSSQKQLRDSFSVSSTFQHSHISQISHT